VVQAAVFYKICAAIYRLSSESLEPSSQINSILTGKLADDLHTRNADFASKLNTNTFLHWQGRGHDSCYLPMRIKMMPTRMSVIRYQLPA